MCTRSRRLSEIILSICVLFIPRFTFLEGRGDGEKKDGSHNMMKEMCERDQGSVR